jgi:hypothetical protein
MNDPIALPEITSDEKTMATLAHVFNLSAGASLH